MKHGRISGAKSGGSPTCSWTFLSSPFLYGVVPFQSVYEFVGTNHRRLKVLWRESLVVGSEHHDSVGCINELLDWQTQYAFHISIVQKALGVGTLGYSQGRSCVAEPQHDEMLETSVQATRTLPVSGRDADN